MRGALNDERARLVSEPSELLESIKRQVFPIVIFDTAHSKFARSLVSRVYRRASLSEYWLLSDSDENDFPEYLIDAILPHSIKKAEFEGRIDSCLNVKSFLDDYHMVGKSDNLKRAARLIAQVAPTDMSTLIIGPSGSGKELVARAVHEHSTRKITDTKRAPLPERLAGEKEYSNGPTAVQFSLMKSVKPHRPCRSDSCGFLRRAAFIVSAAAIWFMSMSVLWRPLTGN
jgi:hypothetical protein